MKAAGKLPGEQTHSFALVTLALGLVPALAEPPPPELIWRQCFPLPDPRGFASPFAGVADGDLLVGGGANFPGKQLWEGGAKVWHDRVFVLKARDGQWELAGRLPVPLGYGVSVTTDDGILCVGGSDSSQHYADVILLKWRGGKLSFQTMPPLPRAIAMSAGARVGNVIYLAGGLESPGAKESLGIFLAFDLDNPAAGWRELPSWPGPGRFQAVSAATAEGFYLFSGLRYEAVVRGESKLVYLRDAYRYTEKSGWERLPDLPHPAIAAASPAPVIAGEVFLIGGADGTGAGTRPEDFHQAPRRMQAYSIERNTWKNRGNAPVGRVCVSAVPWAGSWILSSGERSAGVRSPEVWALEAQPIVVP